MTPYPYLYSTLYYKTLCFLSISHTLYTSGKLSSENIPKNLLPMYIHICRHTHIHTYIYIHTYIRVHTHMYTHMYILDPTRISGSRRLRRLSAPPRVPCKRRKHTRVNSRSTYCHRYKRGGRDMCRAVTVFFKKRLVCVLFRARCRA